ncbi:MAG TPA: caspase family protein [Pyrinomonadaceae bacterium]|jgi:tetratricopeptide (TPR) repeat protein
MNITAPASRARGCALCLLVALAHVSAWPAYAQTDGRGIGVEMRQQQQAAATPANVAELPGKSKRWALVIGVDQYQDAQIGRLNGAANDARALGDALVRYAGFPPDQVILLASDQPAERQPTRVNILRRLSNLSTLVPKDGLLLVSFAGHGMERGGQAYLLPADAQMSDDISFLEDTAVSVARVHERIKATGVAQVIIMLDACRNDPGGRADAPNPLSPVFRRAFNFDVRNREVQAFATLYATAIGERAYEYTEKRQGYFSWALVEGLRGGAANEKGEVTLAALVNFIQNIVPKRIGIDLGAGKRQRPFADVVGYRADELVLAVAAPRTETAINSPAEPAATIDQQAELSYWDGIKNSTNPDFFRAYLRDYPNGRFAAIARLKLQPTPPANSSANRPGGTNPEGASVAPSSSPAYINEPDKKRQEIGEKNVDIAAFNDRLTDLLTRANQAFTAKQYGQAIALYDQGIALDPTQSSFFLNKSITLRVRAVETYNAALIAKDENNKNVARADMRAAVEAAERALRAYRNTQTGGAQANTAPGLSFLQARAESYRVALRMSAMPYSAEAVAALKEYSEAETDQAKRVKARIELAEVIFFQGGNPALAMDVLRGVLALDADNVNALYLAGTVLASDNKPAEARAMLQRFLDRTPASDPRRREAQDLLSYLK